MPCCCLNCPSAYTHDSSGYLLCRVFACIATLRILLMLVATNEVAFSIYYLKGIAESGIHKSYWGPGIFLAKRALCLFILYPASYTSYFFLIIYLLSIIHNLFIVFIYSWYFILINHDVSYLLNHLSLLGNCVSIHLFYHNPLSFNIN